MQTCVHRRLLWCSEVRCYIVCYYLILILFDARLRLCVYVRSGEQMDHNFTAGHKVWRKKAQQFSLQALYTFLRAWLITILNDSSTSYLRKVSKKHSSGSPRTKKNCQTRRQNEMRGRARTKCVCCFSCHELVSVDSETILKTRNPHTFGRTSCLEPM
jgi:hypothetical protein